MDQHLGHAERVGDQAGMLAAGATEAVERVARHVVTALHRDFLDRVRHVLDRDLDEAVGNIFARAAVADLAGELGKSRAHPVGVERQVLLRTENLRKEIRHQLPDHDVGVGEREPSKCKIEPPPAATVWISIIGARMRTPATSVSKARSYSPSKWETSVEVPPMSKPMRWAKPASRPVCAIPTTPPAGPDRIASLPWNRSAAVNPPDDIMNMRRMLPSPSPARDGEADSSCATPAT